MERNRNEETAWIIISVSRLLCSSFLSQLYFRGKKGLSMIEREEIERQEEYRYFRAGLQFSFNP